MSVTVTASNAGGAAPVTSASIGPLLPPAPVNTTAPQITGNPEQGVTLSVNNGVWNNNPTTLTYAWEECTSSGCAAIPGATSSSYTLSAPDIGTTITCVVTATDRWEHAGEQQEDRGSRCGPDAGGFAADHHRVAFVADSGGHQPGCDVDHHRDLELECQHGALGNGDPR